MTPSNFLVIGHLDSIKDVYVNHFNTGTQQMYESHMLITPNSYKFLESNKNYINNRYKIRIYIDDIVNRIDDFISSEASESLSQKRYDIYNHFKNAVFIIRPGYRTDEYGQVQLKSNIQSVYVINNRYIDHNTFTPVPIFNINNTNSEIDSKSKFEDALKQPKQYLGTITASPWPTGNNHFPDGIIWQDNNGYFLYTNIISQKIDLMQYKIQYHKGAKHNLAIQYAERVSYKFRDNIPFMVKKFNKDDLYQNNFIYLDRIAFLPVKLFNGSYANDKNEDINNITNNSGKLGGSSLYNTLFDPINAFNAKYKNNNGVTSKIISKVSITNNKTYINRQSFSTIDNQQSLIDDNQSKSKDTNMTQTDMNTDFIKKLKHLAYTNKPHRLYYDDKDLIDFHTAMKCNGLVVLAGLSGTGKSALINLYAKALGIDNSYQYKFIPVRPFWNDDSDLLGYVDTVHSIYQPADSGLVNTLVDAEHNPQKLYLITFDEMNLARVEYYFSQFLSILEEDPNKRYIQLYNPDLQGRLYNSNKYHARIYIRNNVLFAGTINLDESTHKFSDKVLDRSNIINLKLLPYYKDLEYSDAKPSKNMLIKTISNDDFQYMKNCNPLNKMTTDDLKLLWKLHIVLHNANNNLGIGRRIINQINQYLCNLPKDTNNSINHGDALDLQLVQRVFTKVRGSNTDIGSILDPNSDDTNNLITILKNNSNISKFTRSIHVLKHKYQEIKDYGFTI